MRQCCEGRRRKRKDGGAASILAPEAPQVAVAAFCERAVAEAIPFGNASFSSLKRRRRRLRAALCERSLQQFWPRRPTQQWHLRAVAEAFQTRPLGAGDVCKTGSTSRPTRRCSHRGVEYRELSDIRP